MSAQDDCNLCFSASAVVKPACKPATTKFIMLEGSYLATPISSWPRPTTTPTTPLPTCTTSTVPLPSHLENASTPTPHRGPRTSTARPCCRCVDLKDRDAKEAYIVATFNFPNQSLLSGKSTALYVDPLRPFKLSRTNLCEIR